MLPQSAAQNLLQNCAMLLYITVVSQIKNPLDVTMAYTLDIGKALAKPLWALGLSGKTMVCSKLLLLHTIQDCVLVQKKKKEK